MNHKTDMQADLKRIASEIRAYNPAADEYKGEHIHKVWAREIEAALSGQSAGVPTGYALVPIEPTVEMIAALGFAGDADIAIGHARAFKETVDAYASMIAAAPAPVSAPAPDREQVGETCIAPACHQWDGTDRCTCQHYRALDTLKRVATALPVLRTMLATEGLGGVEVADEMLSDIRALLAEKADASPSRECGDRQRAASPERFITDNLTASERADGRLMNLIVLAWEASARAAASAPTPTAPAQGEPAAWMHEKAETFVIGGWDKQPFAKDFVPLFRETPKAAPAVAQPLTEEQIKSARFGASLLESQGWTAQAQAIRALLESKGE